MKRPKANRSRPARGNKPTIGWAETVDFPEWRIFGLLAKADTGARSSALHVLRLREDGSRHVIFDVAVDGDHGTRQRHDIRARVIRRSRVRSSNGQYEERFFVRTLIRIGEIEREIEISLADRHRMTHRMLIGRTGLKGLLVDSARRHLVTPR